MIDFGRGEFSLRRFFLRGRNVRRARFFTKKTDEYRRDFDFSLIFINKKFLTFLDDERITVGVRLRFLWIFHDF